MEQYLHIVAFQQQNTKEKMKMFDKTRELIRKIITEGLLYDDLSELTYESGYGTDKVSLVYQIETEEEEEEGDKKE